VQTSGLLVSELQVRQRRAQTEFRFMKDLLALCAREAGRVMAADVERRK